MTNYVNSVQQISIVIASGATTGTTTVTAATGTFFVMFQGNSTTATTSLAQAFGRVSISGTTVTATRATSSTNTCTVNACIVDADGTNLISSVQMGTVSLSAAQASNTATISSVTTTNSAICWLGYTQSTTSYHYDLNSMVINLTNSTTVTATNLQGANATIVMGFAVVQFQAGALNQSTQAVTTSFTNSTGSSTSTITSAATASSMIFFAGTGSANGDLAADEQCMATLTNATTVTVSCGNTASGNVVQARYTVVTFVSGVLSQTAQRGSIALTGAASNTATITSAATANTVMNMVGWKSTSTATTTSATIRPRGTQTSATVITVNTESAATTTTYSYEALTFTAGGGGGFTAIQRRTLTDSGTRVGSRQMRTA